MNGMPLAIGKVAQVWGSVSTLAEYTCLPCPLLMLQDTEGSFKTCFLHVFQPSEDQ